MSEIINVADLVNPETGITYRQENAAKQHAYPIGSIVECLPYGDTPEEDYNEHTGLRLFVVGQGRDCDQTPLYILSHNTPAEFDEILELLKESYIIDHSNLSGYNRGLRADFLFKPQINGIAEENLKLIRLPRGLEK